MTVGRGAQSRSSARYTLQLPISIISGEGAEPPGSILNLSREGCLLSTLEYLLPGQSVKMKIAPRDEHPIEASVAWSSDTLYGCTFVTPLSADHLSDILRVNPVSPTEVTSSESFLAKLPEALLAARQASGYTTTELARHLGVSRPTLWAWESGRATPSHDNQQSVLDFLRRSQFAGVEMRESMVAPDNGSNVFFQETIAASRRDLAHKLGLDEDQIRISIKF
ncbi:PilZ domain-containing protein [Qipengyuania sp. XHP0211]|uniref:PilZ domain-containing protein n=1 Tax=Qipengyuania sp. XHP0211 TaxID=3038079 RepID=UPI00241EE125|nr:PilZ domain-containing protein [Qipengyuania sp. XHP0211]MDG5750572.1 PilZ domain-containing protein [Qipengyuania sp. XHP0211]